MRGKREERRQWTKGNGASIGQGCAARHHHGTWRRPLWPSRLRLWPCSLRTTPMAATAVSPSLAESLSGGWRGNKIIPSCVVNSLTPKSILTGTKLVLFGRYILNIYIGIVRYFYAKRKLGVPKSTYRHNAQIGEYCTILTSAKKIRF